MADTSRAGSLPSANPRAGTAQAKLRKAEGNQKKPKLKTGEKKKMSVLSQIPDFYRTEFDTNWEHEVQQMRSRLKDYATVASVSGKEKKFNVFGKQSMQRKTTRGGATRHTDVVLDDYWIRPQVYELSNTFDEYDEEFLGDIVLPKSETIQSHVAAYRRTCDEVIVSALGGTRYSGENGTEANEFPEENEIGVDYVHTGSEANSGLTLAKLIKAKSILGKAEALEPGDPLVFVYTQQQLDDLLFNVSEVKSSDYNQVKALYDGEVEYFMGFHFVRLESLPLVTGVRKCFAYVKSGVKFADSGRKSHLDILPSESHSLQVRTTASLGASRTQDEKVVAVYCD